MEIRHIKHPFGAVVDKDCTIMILGSVPSVKSVEHNFYYMHPHNRFWQVLSKIFGDDFKNADIAERKSLLLKHHIALYDSVEECDILGSSDSKITNVIPADIPSLIEGTKITRIFCNGSASYSNLIKYHPQLENMTEKLPSTSPANAAFNIDKLVAEWIKILN